MVLTAIYSSSFDIVFLLFVQSRYSASYTYNVPIVLVDLDLYTFTGYSIYRCSDIAGVYLWYLIFDSLKCAL